MNQIGENFFRAAVVFAALSTDPLLNATEDTLRPPSVPLVASDPYFSIWSPADKLTDADPTHWTGKPHRLTSQVIIDDKLFRIMGTQPGYVPALPQTGLQVLPTRTIYSFEGSGVALTLTFMTAALPEDIDLLSRPVTYVTYDVRSTDGKEHKVGAMFSVNPEIAVNDSKQLVRDSIRTVGELSVARVGSVEQPVLKKKGDDLRIDWGYLYLAAPKQKFAVAPNSFEVLSDVSLTDTDSWRTNKVYHVPRHSPKPEADQSPIAAEDAPPLVASLDFRHVGAKLVSRWLMLAYDDEYSIQYFKQNLRPYWRRNGDTAIALIKKSAADYPALVKRCAKFDEEFMADLRKAGGEKYARLCALVFRQAIAGTKLAADENGQPLLFPKENTSNGCIGTVDVIYPMSPLFLLSGSSLSKAMLVPPLDYASSPRWKFPFAPHDLGTYPLANAQVYGGGERTEENQMPVEETANMIILTTALAEQEGNADFAAKYWPVLAKWADYLKAKGFDPERQLCTDDFAGHLAHNVNLSAKAIVAIGAYGHLCEMRGLNAKAKEYGDLAKQYAARWVKEADDGDHFRLAFDQPGTWSQKYNLIWDRVLGLKLFPEEVMAKEMAYYAKVMDKFGLALDNRKPYAELPWSFWTASLTGNRADFEKLLDPVYDYANQTPSRVPFPDFYWTRTSKEAGMHARPVIGGIFICPLLDRAMWNKWAGRDVTKSAGWASLPLPPKIAVVVPAADTAPALWRYTTIQPAADWSLPEYSDGSWQEGKSGFGTAGTPGANVGTTWNNEDIWLRREIELPAGDWKSLQAWLHHDEDAEVYLNGVLALKVSGWINDYEAMPLTDAGRAALKPGKNLVAVHCHQTTGGQYVDVGFIKVETPPAPTNIRLK